MERLIITTPEELRALLEDVIHEHSNPAKKELSHFDNMPINEAVEFLNANGFPTTKGSLYKLTSSNVLPHGKFGNKLIFSRKQLLEWAISHTKQTSDNGEAMMNMIEAAWQRSKRKK